ncbi:MAG: DUF3127 domain-containing protein [Chitinophagales bacterium]|nr:DUF3127 domain-containing protein [Chitinophagales bacterium]MDW8427037.1 DUF3127 domain-containing protein [Chitinophagales bacterium]
MSQQHLHHVIFTAKEISMALEISGRVVAVLPRQEGTSVNGRWTKQGFVVETDDRYPKKICFVCWNERADDVARLQPGMQVTVAFDLESREYNGRWYTDARAWRISVGDQPAVENTAGAAAPVAPEDDDLPF